MARMDRVLEIDDASRIARIQAGAFGPALEEQLNARGWTIGHFPDSFTHSTLGGWIATRSSGMQSDKYGDVADLTRAVRVVTPAGTLVTRPVPTTLDRPERARDGARQRGPPRDHQRGDGARAPPPRAPHDPRLPASRTGAARSQAMRAIAESDAAPSVTRVSDAPETRFSFATRKAPTAVDRLKSKGLTAFLERKSSFGDLERMCLAFIGYEGSKAHVATQRKLVGKIVSAHGGVCIGSSPGELYDQKKFDTPYIRDFLLDRGALADVSETSAPWGVLPVLYDNVMAAAARRVRRSRRARLRHVPPVAQLPRGRVPVLHVRVQAGAGGRADRPVRPRQGRDPAGVHRLRARRCRTTTRSARSTRAGWRRTSRRRASRCSARCSTAWTRART